MVSVLVACATRHGATREVADAIAASLRADGATADVRAAWSVRASVAGRDLIVLGAPLYSGRWLPSAHRFLKRHREDLQHVPVAVFALGPRERTDQAWSDSRAQLDRALAQHQWLNPAATALFGGADELGRSLSPRRDLRDWAAIRAWAVEVSQHAHEAETKAGAQKRP
ncbi:MAG: flavodoxin domain-containing protein [Actinomycetes bacterium]